jgi:hypothetical protein
MGRDNRSAALVQTHIPQQRGAHTTYTPGDLDALVEAIRVTCRDHQRRNLDQPRCHIAVVGNPRMGNIAVYGNSLLLLTAALRECGGRDARVEVNPKGAAPGSYTFRGVARCM